MTKFTNWFDDIDTGFSIVVDVYLKIGIFYECDIDPPFTSNTTQNKSTQNK